MGGGVWGALLVCVGGRGDKSQGLFNIQSACVNCRANIFNNGQAGSRRRLSQISLAFYFFSFFSVHRRQEEKLLVQPM